MFKIHPEVIEFISLFSGIGGLDKGLEDAGMRCVAQVEIDPFCQKVLTKHWPDVPKFEDVRNVGKENLPAANLIAGGFPCQPFSVAGKQKGTEDDRHLWPEMLRVISELQPTWVLGENVPGIIPIFLDEAISDLEDEGYETEQFVIPACAFDAPHRRDRLFIVAYGEKVRRLYGINEKQPAKRNKHAQCKSDPSGSYGFMGDTKIQSINGGNDQSKEGRTQIPQPRNPISKGGASWKIEPKLGRVADGVPNRVDRLKSLGNAVVPQVAEFIGRMIIEANKCPGR